MQGAAGAEGTSSIKVLFVAPPCLRASADEPPPPHEVAAAPGAGGAAAQGVEMLVEVPSAPGDPMTLRLLAVKARRHCSYPTNEWLWCANPR